MKLHDGNNFVAHKLVANGNANAPNNIERIALIFGLNVIWLHKSKPA